MKMDLNDDAIQQIVSKAILDSLTPEKRDELMTAAVANLLDTEESSGYGSTRKTHLLRAFEEAARAVAMQVARDEMSKDEAVKAKIREMFLKAWERTTTGEAQEKLIEKIGYAIEKAITGDRY